MQHDRCAMSFKTAGDYISRSYSGSGIKLELQNRPGCIFQIVGIRTLPFAVSQLVGSTVSHGAGATYSRRGTGDKGGWYRARSDGCIARYVAFSRHTNRKRRSEFEVSRPSQLLDNAYLQLWGALIVSSKVCL